MDPDPAYSAASQEVRDKVEADPRLWISAAQPYFDTMKDPRGNKVWYDRSPEAADLGYTAHYYFSPKKFTNLDGPESSPPVEAESISRPSALPTYICFYAEAIAPGDAPRPH